MAGRRRPDPRPRRTHRRDLGDPAEAAGRSTHRPAERARPARRHSRTCRPDAPPVWIGGVSNAALRRAVTYGQGWLAALLSPDELADRVAELTALAQQRGVPTPQTGTMVFATLTTQPARSRCRHRRQPRSGRRTARGVQNSGSRHRRGRSLRPDNLPARGTAPPRVRGLPAQQAAGAHAVGARWGPLAGLPLAHGPRQVRRRPARGLAPPRE